MEPAIDLINRALCGDPGARSFLERTTSVYVLDVTDKTEPKTYGGWNFIHQAMNEIERHETRQTRQGQDNFGNEESECALVGHARLLATMALRVARRSPLADKILVTRCISNASEYTGRAKESDWLVDINYELREIVIGRIAAMALDFSFHRAKTKTNKSAFGDRVVMDTFCAILSANAVASGPAAIRHFATEWIIPACSTLPAFAVASVVLHLAGEALRISSPAGTTDALQQLSVSALQSVLLPILSEAITENSNEAESSKAVHEENSLIAAMCLRAMKTWCEATDLSLPQMKHICNKVDADLVGVINDCMYSDSYLLIDELAEFIEATVLISDSKVMSEGRMNQARHVIGVDEMTFKSQLSGQQLMTIEVKEMSLIVNELVSGIGMQRFRFTERQNNGETEVCCNLARIAASVCRTRFDLLFLDGEYQSETGAVAILMKAAAHPSIHICGIGLEVLGRMLDLIPQLPQDLLPILQRRAIIPHRFRNNKLSLDATDLCGVDFDEFHNFRESVLADTLVACWKSYGDQFMDSCTSAVEEFCSSTTLPVDVSLQLEAALFCIEKVGCEAFSSILDYPHDEQMTRVVQALSSRPASFLSNALTRYRMCRCIQTYAKWIGGNGVNDIVSDLLISSIKESFLQESTNDSSGDWKDFGISPATAAAEALECLLITKAESFVNNARLGDIHDLWEQIYTCPDIQRKIIPMESRLALCRGLAHAFAYLAEDQSTILFDTQASKTIHSLDRLVANGQYAADEPSLLFTQECACQEIVVIGEMFKTYLTVAQSLGHASHSIPVLDTIAKGWRSITFVSATWSYKKEISTAFVTMLSCLIPPLDDNDCCLNLLKDLCEIVASTRVSVTSSHGDFDQIFDFTCKCIDTYGDLIEKGLSTSVAGISSTIVYIEVVRIIEKLILDNVAITKGSLGKVFSNSSQQKNGQDAFESKPAPKVYAGVSSCDSLGAVFTMLTRCLNKCPLFALKLPAVSPGSAVVNGGSDSLLRRAVDASVESLATGDPVLTNNAILFLIALAEHRYSTNDALHSFVVDSLSRIEEDCIVRLVGLSCAKIEFQNLGNVAVLLLVLLENMKYSNGSNNHDKKAILASSFHYQNQFLLGDAACDAGLITLLRWSDVTCGGNGTGNNSSSTSSTNHYNECRIFLETIWTLHQVEETDSLPASDRVASFVAMYS